MQNIVDNMSMRKQNSIVILSQQVDFAVKKLYQ